MRVALLGDIALIGKYDITKNKKVKERIKILADELSKYDYVIGNLESPLTDEKKTLVCKSMHLKSSSVNVELLKYLNINAVCLANNHLYDYGKKGFQDTIDILNSNNIEWFGANSKYLTKDIKGEKISISGFCCYSTNGSGYIKNDKSIGINTMTYENICKQLECDSNNDAFTIMSMHWGDEHTNYPKYEHIELVKKIASKKDVLIFGHHPHIIQGMQQIRNTIVAYSLGNFLFDDCISINGSFELKQNEENKKTFIFGVEIKNGTVIKKNYNAFKDKNEGFEFFDINEELESISKKLNNIDSIDSYQQMRISQISKVSKDKFGKKNFKWIKSRLNYYSIGALISRKIREKVYLKERNNFMR